MTTCAEAEKTGEGEVRKKSSAVVSRALSEDSQRLWLCFQLTVFLSVLSSKGITISSTEPPFPEGSSTKSIVNTPASVHSINVPRKTLIFLAAKFRGNVLFKASCLQNRDLLWSFSQALMRTSLSQLSVRCA